MNIAKPEGRMLLRRARAAMRAARVLDAEGELESAERELGQARAIYETILERTSPPSGPGPTDGSARRLRRSFAEARSLDFEAERRVLGTSALRVRARRALPPLLVTCLATAAYFAYALGARPFANVRDSGTFFADPSFSGEKAFDGQLDTEWLLPDRTTGHVDLFLFPARDVRSIVLVNGHNRHFMDRAVRTFEVQLHRDGVLVHASRGEFRELTNPGERSEIRLPSPVADVDHVRVVVHAHMGLGGALAEILLR